MLLSMGFVEGFLSLSGFCCFCLESFGETHAFKCEQSKVSF